VIGTVNLEIDPARRMAMIGFAIGQKYQGKGIGAEAARAVVAWAFQELDLVKLWATADARNARSRRLLEKLGMKCEGILHGEELARDGRADRSCYGILREEWYACVHSTLG
jgi:RimJ/RimL family protein N-acetyltransferase